MPREMSGDEPVPRDGFGQVPTQFAIQAPKKVPRVDYERIFVLDEEMKLLGEYALREYAVALQRAFRTANGKPDVSDGSEENPPPPDVTGSAP